MALSVLAPFSAAQAPPTTFTTLYSFTFNRHNGDGASPTGVVFGNGALYGTTSEGGTSPCPTGLNGCGTVFELRPHKAAAGAWTETVLYRFTGQNQEAANPFAGLAVGKNGALYGTTWYGGAAGSGAAFELIPGTPWAETVLYSFLGGNRATFSDGASPSAALILGNGGALYGTTVYGGGPYGGTVFELAPGVPGAAWTETIRYSFTGLNGDGSDLSSGVVKGANGVFYGTTQYGGNPSSLCPTAPAGCGIVFALTPARAGAWTATTLYSFGSQNGDGSGPAGNLVIGSNGALYGTTTYGGTEEFGTVFELAPPASPGGAWTETVLHSFTGKNGDGAGPNAGVVIGSNGVLYGTTAYGGASLFSGTVFRLMPPAASAGPWTETILHSFTGQNGDGANPSGGLVIGRNGALYGTTEHGGTSDSGTVFELVP